MNQPITIAVDAMGGDNAPGVIIKGVLQAVRANPVKIILVGDKIKIEDTLKKLRYSGNDIEIVHTVQTIQMGESPKDSVHNKPDASIVLAAKLVSDGRADALVSAGSTGAVVLSAAKYIPRIYGVRRTAIATVYPTMNEFKRNDHLAFMLDVGANVHCSAEELVQFAIMGSSYVSEVREIANPTISLLNNGEEPSKGGEKMQKAYRMLSETSGVNFIGNIEGKDVLRGVTDVIVTEGFVGNIVIKTLEGAAKTVGSLSKLAFKMKWSWKIGLLMLRKGMQALKEITDYAEYGGAPLLGFEKIVIAAHGRSNEKAISNAIALAGKCVRDDVCGQIEKRIKDFEMRAHSEYDRMTEEF